MARNSHSEVRSQKSEARSQKKEVRVQKPEKINPLVRLSSNEEEFQTFYAAYPKHVGRKEALKAWTKLQPDKDLLATMLKSINTWRLSEQWTKNGGQYIPQPATWLNQARWEDEPQTKTIPDKEPKKGSGLRNFTKERLGANENAEKSVEELIGGIGKGMP
jgi:hypothetical protein